MNPTPTVSILTGFQERCPDCAARIGELHDERCDEAECAVTGLKRYGVCRPLSCGREPGTDCRTPWTGTPAALASCQELGWYCLPAPGYPSCPPGTPGAMEDLNRLFARAVWDRAAQRWRAPVQAPEGSS